jgi:hypothetical protein
MIRRTVERVHAKLFSEPVKSRVEMLIIVLSLAGFLVHLALILAQQRGWIHLPSAGSMLDSPISAVYTPFSFILVYEVFLLVYHLDESFTNAVAKQYEIIALIEVRAIFKDISKLDNTENWFLSKYNLQLAVDMVGFLLIFWLIYFFYRLRERRPVVPDSPQVSHFIVMKKAIAVLLIPILAGLIVYSLVNWGIEVYQYNQGVLSELTDINNIFYDEFFTTLILVDVFLLILSFRFTNFYSLLIRNTGYIVSTVLIRLSFTTVGLFNMVLVVGGVLFGTLTLLIYNQIGRLYKEEAGESSHLN